MNRRDLRVWGQDLPPIVAGSLGVMGAGATALAVFVGLTATAAEAEASSVPPAPSAVVVAPIASSLPSVEPAPTTRAADVCAPAVFNFPFGSSVVEAPERAAADRLGAWLLDRPSSTVLVHGHADALGSDDGNLAMSRARAQAIASRLLTKGVARTRITVRGFGSYQPVEGAPEEAASNRRVVVYVKDANECPTALQGVDR